MRDLDEEITAVDQYTDYLTKHIDAVKKAYWLLVNKGIVKADYDLDCQIDQHDESKYSHEEWDAYLHKFYEPEKHKEIDFKYAWNHHQHNNPHHPQYWTLQEDDNPGVLEALDMPYNYIVEMICDWLAFSIIENDLSKIQTWYKEKGCTYLLSDKTKATVEDILKKIKNLK